MTIGKSRIFLIWAPLCLFFVYQFILRVSPNVMTQEILVHFQINATNFGILTSLYYLGYAVMQIPIGILLDKYGPKQISAFCALLCVIGALLFSSSDFWGLALFARFLIGVGSSGAFISATKVIRSWAPEKYFSIFVSITITIGLLSAHQAGNLTSYFMTLFGWKKTVLYLGLGGLLLTGFILLCVKNNPKKEKEEIGDKIFSKVFLSKLFAHLIDKKIIWIGFWGAFLTGPLYVLGDVWGVSYMMNVFNWNKHQATEASTIIYFGMACGGPLVAAFSEKFNRHRKNIIAFLAFGMGLILAFEMLVKPPYEVVLFLNFIVGAFCSYQILVFSLVVLNTPPRLSGVTFGVVNTINMLSGFVYLPLVGYVLDKYWKGAMEGGIPIYSAETYQMAISVIVVGLFIGGTGFLFTRLKKT